MTQETQWGPAIPVDGKRPGWLGEFASRIGYQRTDGTWYGPHPKWPNLWSERDILENKGGWETVTAIRLPADHPHYRQTEEAPIDWSGELEAVHEDGRVVRVRLHSDDGGKILPMRIDRELSDGVDDCIEYFDRDGSCNVGGWRIRNVPQPTPQADTKPDLRARMTLEEAEARGELCGCCTGKEGYVQCLRDLGLILPVSDDVDLIEARDIAASYHEQETRSYGLGAAIRSGDRDFGPGVTIARRALARGRALALAGEEKQ